MTKKKKYRKPTIKLVSLKTEESILQTCRSSREYNPLGPCNRTDTGGDCETVLEGGLNDKCMFKTEPAS